VTHPRILGIGTANPPVRLTQEQSFHAAGYQGERIRKIFLNSDIDYRHFYLEGSLNRDESSDQLNQRYLRGAMKTGCRAILNCVTASGTTVQDVDFLAFCTCTGYVCPDVGSRLIAHMGFSNNVQRASVVGLGCAGALPALQRTVDFYSRVFNLPRQGQGQANLVQLAVGKAGHLSIRQGAKPGFDHFAIGIEGFNKDRVIADLRARGATPIDGGDGAGLHVADPDGLFVQVIANGGNG